MRAKAHEDGGLCQTLGYYLLVDQEVHPPKDAHSVLTHYHMKWIGVNHHPGLTLEYSQHIHGFLKNFMWFPQKCSCGPIQRFLDKQMHRETSILVCFRKGVQKKNLVLQLMCNMKGVGRLIFKTSIHVDIRTNNHPKHVVPQTTLHLSRMSSPFSPQTSIASTTHWGCRKIYMFSWYLG